MSKILKNTTGTDIELDIVGLFIPASGQITVSTETYLDLASEDSVTELTSLINAGDIIVNDSINDLSASDGIEYIKFPNFAETVRVESSSFTSKDVKSALEELAGQPAEEYCIFPIWAEENAGLGNNQREWSFGNGATGDIGIVLPFDAQIIAVSYNADNAGTNTEVAVVINTSSQVATTGPQSGEDGFNTLVTPVSISAGDRLGFQTITAGGASDVRVCAWLRVPSSLVIDLGLGELNDVVLTSPSNGEALIYNGSQWVNQALPSAPVDSVNGQTGVVVLDADDIDDSVTTNKFATQAELDQIATNTGNIATNTTNISNNTSNISTNTTNIANNTSNISTNTTNIAVNTSNIATNTANIATNASNIATNASNIATNTADIATNDADILELELNQDDLVTLSGVPENSTNLGTFTGTTIPDNQNNKQAMQSLETGLETHISDTANPHNTTFTQVVTADPATDITAAEAEELTDGSNADNLHKHSKLFSPDNTTELIQTDNSDQVAIGNFTGKTIERTAHINGVLRVDRDANSSSIVFARTDGPNTVEKSFGFYLDSTSSNNGEFSIRDLGTAASGAGNERLVVLNNGDIQLNEYPQTRNDTTSNDEKVLTTDSSGVLQLRRVLPFYASIKKISNAVNQVGVNQTTTFADYLTLNVNIPETGNYDIDWRYVWSYNDGGNDFRSLILLDGSPISTFNEHRQEPKDTGGGGINLLNTTGGVTNTGTNQRYRLSDFEPEVNLTAGVHTITIQWAGSTTNDEAAIYEGAIRIKRVS